MASATHNSKPPSQKGAKKTSAAPANPLSPQKQAQKNELCDFPLPGDWKLQDLSQSGVHRDELVSQALQMARRTKQQTYIYLATQFTRPTFLITTQADNIYPPPEQVMALHPDGRILLFIRKEVLGRMAV